MDNIAIGNYLLKLRTEKGLTQIQVAEILGVSNKAVSKWECGEALPSVEMLVALSKLYGVSVDEILHAGSTFDKHPVGEASRSAKPRSPAPEGVFILLDIIAIIVSALSMLLAFLLVFLANLAAALWGGLVPLLVSLGLWLSLHFLDAARNASTLRKTAAIILVPACFSNFFIVLLAIVVSIQFPIDIAYVNLTGFLSFLILIIALVPAIPLGVGIARGNLLRSFGPFSSTSGLTIAILLSITMFNARDYWYFNVIMIGIPVLLLAAASITTLVIKKWHLSEGILSIVACILAIIMKADYAGILSTVYAIFLLIFLIVLAVRKKKGIAALHESSLNE